MCQLAKKTTKDEASLGDYTTCHRLGRPRPAGVIHSLNSAKQGPILCHPACTSYVRGHSWWPGPREVSGQKFPHDGEENLSAKRKGH